MSDDPIESIKTVFQRADLNGDGVIHRDELKAVMQILDPVTWDDSNVDTLLAAMDFDKDGGIQFEELVAWLKDRPSHSLFELVHNLKVVDMYFQPGELGLDANWNIGCVSTVITGQGKDLGVQAGWIMCRIDGERYSEKLLHQKIEGTDSYAVAFMVPLAKPDIKDNDHERFSPAPIHVSSPVFRAPRQRSPVFRAARSMRQDEPRRRSSRSPSKRATSSSPRRRSSSPVFDAGRVSLLSPGESPFLLCHGLGANSTETSIKQTPVTHREPEEVHKPLYAGDSHASRREEMIEAERVARAAKRAAWQAEQERASQVVIEYVVASGESTNFADELVLDFKNKRTLGEAVPEGTEGDHKYINRMMMRKKRTRFGEKFTKNCPWPMTAGQEKEVIRRILRLPCSELSALDPSEDIACYSSALESALHDNFDLFVCSICYDPMVSIAGGVPNFGNMWWATAKKTEHWTNRPCDHAQCRDCMKGWVESCINDSKPEVKCPAPTCSYNLWDYDIQSLVSPEAFARHQEHTRASYMEHLKDVMKEDAALKSWLMANARPCPACHVIVSRYEGCNIMMCVCGERFMYCCGFRECRCGKKKKKPDIWKPKE